LLVPVSELIALNCNASGADAAIDDDLPGLRRDM